MAFSRTFSAWKFITPDKVIVKLPFYTLAPQSLIFNRIEHCPQGNQIILEFLRKSEAHKAPEYSGIRHETPRNESPGAEYSDKSDPIWR